MFKAPADRAQRGVALAIVLWFIAGMSLLVAGIVAQARVDTRMTQIHLARAVVAAAGDGAIQLMLADMMANRAAGSGAHHQPPDGRYRMGEIEAVVVMVPNSALIDISAASVDVLAALFQLAGKLDENGALRLAESVVQSRSFRSAPEGRGAVIKLDSIEDLLRVPGVSRTLLDSVRNFIMVGGSAGGAADGSLALRALIGGLAQAPALPGEVPAARPDGAATWYSRPTAGTDTRSSDAYRADAIVQIGDKIWLRRRWISLESSSSSALPWRVVRTEPPRVLMTGSIY